MPSVGSSPPAAAEGTQPRPKVWFNGPVPLSFPPFAEESVARRRETMRGYRVELLRPQGRIAPYITGAIPFDEPQPGVISASCGRGGEHPIPHPPCTCGIYVCDAPESLITLTRAAEGTLGAAARFARRRGLQGWWFDARVAILAGTLYDALPLPPTDEQHRLFTLYNDNLGVADAIIHALKGGTREVLTYGVTGDPPGTWRGSRFATEHAVIMTFPGDRAKDYQNILPCKTKIVTAAGPDDVLSARLKRHADSGSTDHRWWLAASESGQRW